MFKRIADILRKHNPSVATEWCNIKRGAQSGSILDSYPGDDAVDIVGVNYYDNLSALNDEATWKKQYNATIKGGPWGIGAWLDFAKSRGKRFACSEWGISVGTSPGTKDNPFYIEKMFEFFRANASSIAYEHYFNQKPRHQLTPGNVNPLSSARYKQLWGR
jgi:beta-mannanase